ncbi:hypothetical protein N7530_011442 [Penicillium desertorum]|uniref:Uncharacterized protein n=1 Tax=Penicillium desertorum TaxID=1303715 RepID=A0A9W9WDK3_9EURO|nr:hypothetical protein N7530_012669 [Penicillium desertorum]KAJ5456168.1 hypothetical protein N7530_011442 [Penicillium desertorum]
MRSAIIVDFLGTAAAIAPSATQTTETSIDKLSSSLKIETWDGLDCQGAGAGFTEFNTSVLALNISNYFVSRSFRLNRTLEGQEQLDLSVTNDHANW